MRVLLYIQKNLCETISLEELAQTACFSPYHFHRIFRGMVGETVAEYIRRIRLEYAAQALRRGQKSVTDLAFEIRYESVEAFTRAFREQFGVNPGSYRKTNGGEKLKPLSIADFAKGEIKMKIEVVNVPARRVAFVRHTGPYDQCGAVWEKLCLWAGPRGLLQPGVEFLGLCYDDPDVTEPEKIRYDACITVSEGLAAEGEIGVQTLEAGLYARTTHHGSYQRLAQTYAELCGRWAPENGYELRPIPGFEVYLNSPDETPENELLTDIYVPIEKLKK